MVLFAHNNNQGVFAPFLAKEHYYVNPLWGERREHFSTREHISFYFLGGNLMSLEPFKIICRCFSLLVRLPFRFWLRKLGNKIYDLLPRIAGWLSTALRRLFPVLLAFVVPKIAAALCVPRRTKNGSSEPKLRRKEIFQNLIENRVMNFLFRGRFKLFWSEPKWEAIKVLISCEIRPFIFHTG